MHDLYKMVKLIETLELWSVFKEKTSEKTSVQCGTPLVKKESTSLCAFLAILPKKNVKQNGMQFWFWHASGLPKM